MKPTERKHHRVVEIRWVLPAYLGLLTVFGIMRFEDRQEDRRNNRERTEQISLQELATARNTYSIALINYSIAAAQRASCINAVTARNDNRLNWEAAAAVVREVGNEEFATRLEAEVDRNTPERSTDECPKEPAPPVIPSILEDELNVINNLGTIPIGVSD